MSIRSVVRIVVAASLILMPRILSAAAKDEKKPAPGDKDLYSQVELFSEALSVVRADYVEEPDPKKLIYGALDGMLASLDDFSQFLTPEDLKDMEEETRGEFGGIGIELATKDGILTVIAPIDGTPAAAAGVRPGDRIIKIDSLTLRGVSLDEAISMMRGKPGTEVALTIWRDSEKKVIDVKLKRALIKVQSVKDVRIIADRIGYIKLTEFQERTTRYFEEALDRLEKQGMRGLILDMRNNPGGLLDAAIGVVERFLPKDAVIVSTKGRIADQNMIYKSSGAMTHPGYPLVVLVNGGSASGSEVVAGALQDHARAVILGTRTFGKASVQTVIPLRDGSALRLTTAGYVTPKGRMIGKSGIVPDVVIGPEESDADLGEDLFDKAESAVKNKVSSGPRDAELERAVDLMKGLLVYGAGKTE